MLATLPDDEHHYYHRIGWMRAAVLGANDGIVSTGSLIIGVAAASAAHESIILAGIAALAAGAMSMAAGEYVSVSSQADTEKSDLAIESQALLDFPEEELKELADIYEARGLTRALAEQVAIELTQADALGAHARDELGMSDTTRARPVQAAVASAVSFAIGAGLPLSAAVLSPLPILTTNVATLSLVSLAGLGFVSAVLGGAPKVRAMLRVLFWGTAAMIVTGAIGHLFGTVI